MEKINHTFFGELDLVKGLENEIDFGDDVIVLWEKEINEINISLWYDKAAEITIKTLDAFTKFITDFKQNDEKARLQIEKYLSEDNEYIVFHREEIELDLPEDPREFVQNMKVRNIGLWTDEENTIIVDYMIAPGESDQILAVRFNDKLEFMDISWES
ncbi:Protein of unknown function [Peptostreptococcaceae bacterium pGA-8]|nr:Protein of unknown function [Peptostreptococcaceae bacterium pGA-8]